jgi:cell division septation protein DedD
MRAKKKKIKDRYQNFKRALTLCVGSAVVVCGLFAVAWTVDYVIQRSQGSSSLAQWLPFDIGIALTSNHSKDKASEEGSPPVSFSFYETLFKKQHEQETFNLQPSVRGKPKAGREGERGKGRLPTATTTVKAQDTQKQKATPPLYTIQIGSFQGSEAAQSFTRALQQKGYKPYIVTTSVPGKGTVCRVRIGKFRDLAEAQEFALEIEKKEKIPVLITSR